MALVVTKTLTHHESLGPLWYCPREFQTKVLQNIFTTPMCTHVLCKHRGNKIRQGSANEENALIEHLLGLAPAGYLLEEAGQLCEVLVLLGHFKDALVLQRQLSAWTRLHQVSCLPDTGFRVGV